MKSWKEGFDVMIKDIFGILLRSGLDFQKMGEVEEDVTNLCGEMIYFLYLRICPNNARVLSIHIMISEAKYRFFGSHRTNFRNFS